MKLGKTEVVIKNAEGEIFIMDILTRMCRPIPGEMSVKKEQTKKAWNSVNFADSIVKLAKEEFAAGKHKTLIDAYSSIINQYPEGYEQYSKENTSGD